MNVKVAIIILNWNGFQDTVECLQSIRRSDYPEYKAVLVDNASKNNEGARLKEMFPEIQLMQNAKNRGFAGGNNDGMNWALDNGYEYIVNINNDCVVDKGWLSALVKGLEDTGSDFGESRIMFYGEKDLISTDGEAVLLNGLVVSLNHGKNRSSPGMGARRKIYFACGAASIYSAKCLKDVKINEDQFFDELFFAYYEDADLGIRLNVKNYVGTSVPDSIVYHKMFRTVGEGSVFQKFQLEKNRLLFCLLNYPFYLIVAGEFIYFAMFVKRMLFYPVKKKKSAKVPPLGPPGAAKIFFRARVWIIVNFKDVMKDRSERKKRGFINRRIINLLSWDFPEASQRKG